MLFQPQCIAQACVVVSVLLAVIEAHCDRAMSRHVRNALIQHIHPSFKSLEPAIPAQCPFTLNREMFWPQEQHKIRESPAKWQCDYCGKAFHAESFLDMHFENRHAHATYTGDDSVCLADFCDVFRCNVIIRIKKAEFWEMALCIEDDMQLLNNKCQGLVNSCISDVFTANETEYLRGVWNESICSYLSCDRYWESPVLEQSQAGILLYTVMTVMISFGLIIYYIIAYSHFYTDESIWDQIREESFVSVPENKYPRYPYNDRSWEIDGQRFGATVQQRRQTHPHDHTNRPPDWVT